MNNTKKFLSIIEILFPVFNKAEDENGNIDYSKPLGRLLFIPKPVRNTYKNIWKQKGSKGDVLFVFGLNLILSVLLIPAAIISWAISQLIFAMHYDKHNRKSGSRTHLLTAYTMMLVLFISAGVMCIDYKINGQDRYIDLTTKVFTIQDNPEVKPDRKITRTFNDVVTSATEPENKPVITTTYTETCVTTIPETVVENVSELAVTEPEAESETVVNTDDGYSLKRKSR